VNRARRTAAASVVVVLAAAGVGSVFRIHTPLFWTAGLGDWLDPYFINSLLEWWYVAILRIENPVSPPVFHPVEGTLGYSHGLILFAPFYVPLRLVLHPFQAYNLAMFLVVLTGTLCLYAWFRRALQLSVVEAGVLTAFFAASPNVLDTGVNIWTQRASVYLVPPILLLVSAAVSGQGRRRLVWAFAAGLLATLLFTQDFYSAQFTFFFAGIWLLPRVLLALRQVFAWTSGRPAARALLVLGVAAGVWTLIVAVSGGVSTQVLGVRIRSTDALRPGVLAAILLSAAGWWMRDAVPRPQVRRPPGVVSAALVGVAGGAAVFLWIYLPVYLTYPGFAEEEYLRVLRERSVSSLWSPIAFLRGYEGFATLRSFVLLLIAVAAGCLATRTNRPLRAGAAVVWLAAALLVFLIPFRFGDFSVWGTFFRPLPGFDAIRDPLRIIYQFELAVVLGVALVLAGMRGRARTRGAVTGVGILLILLSPNRTVFEYNRPNSDFDRWVAAPVRVDPSCRSFYMAAGPAEYDARSHEPWTLYSNDAAFLAMRLGVPTLHGFSAWTPMDWHVRHPHAADFAWGVGDWTARHRLAGVCEMDVERRTMTPGLPATSSTVR
jgi:hypothetical protein